MEISYVASTGLEKGLQISAVLCMLQTKTKDLNMGTGLSVMRLFLLFFLFIF
jgi:hypothetical protein